MLETGSVQRLHVTQDMTDWWAQQLRKSQASSTTEEGSSRDRGGGSVKEDITKRGDSQTSEHQWGETLPGRGGT